MSFYEQVSWAQNPLFRAYWQHYEACQKWRQQHLINSKKAECLAKPSTSYEVGKEKKLKNRKLGRKEEKKQNVWNLEEIFEVKPEKIEENLEEEEEMSEEMKEFFEKTLAHRKERDEKRKALQNSDKSWLQDQDDEYVNVEKIKIRGRAKKSAKPVDEQAATIERRKTAQNLYGSAKSDQILAMETVLELNFENEYAKSTPQMWPNIPFHF
ncbi:unnamed protein product [Caenorhabditis angaria]|uniref:Gem-associated protein 8 n=1 Tax=Caenorhabditis angaria TaxID=860376 RepID=A0A9P1MZ98_9PELO|nr:unnamed protein product [Caenorhabditis angaria]